MFTTDQRTRVIELLEEPPDDFSVGFLVRRGIDIFLIQIDATSQQKDFVWREIEAVEKETNSMIRKNHAIRLALAREWAEKDVDPKYVRNTVNESADLITAYVHDQVDRSLRLYAQFGPVQKEKIAQRLESGKTCAPGQEP